MRRFCLLLLLFTLLAWSQQSKLPSPAGDVPLGTVTGSFTVNGKTAQFKHVLALVKEDSFHEGQDDICVYFSDAPMDAAAVREPGAFEGAAEGKVHAIEVCFDENLKPASGQLYHDGFGEGYSMSVSGMHQFIPRFYDGKTLAGRLFVEKYEGLGDDKWSYTATFNAAIQPKPRPEALTPAALDSPPARAVQAFLKAVQSKDKEAIKKTVAPDMAADLDGPRGKELLAMLPEMFDSKLQITRIGMLESGDKAVITLEHKETGSHETVTIKAGIVNGAWKVIRN